MNALRSALFSPTPRALWNWGRLVLGGALALALLVVVLLAWKAPGYLPYILLLVLAGLGLWLVLQHPLLNLCAVLAGFVLVANYSEGISALEVVYGLYALGYLACWFASRLFLYRERIVDTPDAAALFLFLVALTASLGLSLFFGARPGALVSEWSALLLLGFYFPIREACLRYPAAPAAILLILAWIGVFIAVRNGLEYYAGLNNARYLFEILKNRNDTNGVLVMAIGFFYLIFVVYAERWRDRAALLFGLLLSAGILLLSQSRALWVSYAVGAFLIFLFVRGRQRARLVTLGLVAGGGLLTVGFLFFGDILVLILTGLIERAATLSQASSDFSLRLREVEAQAALEHVYRNPILGHGVAVPYRFYDMETERTVVRTFIHNGYVSLWYRFGLWGTVLVLVFWGRSIWNGLTVYWRKEAPLLLRLCGLGAAISLMAFVLSAYTSNPFYLKDTTFLFGILTGLAAGVHGRARLLAAAPPQLSPP